MRARTSGRSQLAALGALMLFSACAPDGPSAAQGEPQPQTDIQASGSFVEPQCCGEGSAPQGPLVVFLGTSLTEGYGLDSPSTEAWPARIAERAEAAGLSVRVQNAGLSGETSAGARRRVGWVLDATPNIFVLETGANDGLRGLSVSQLEENLDAILGQVRARAPNAALVVIGMEAPPNLGADYASEFRSVYPRVAERWNAEWVPFLLDGVAGVLELNQADRIHPTAEGHDRMAEGVWPLLARLLAAHGGDGL